MTSNNDAVNESLSALLDNEHSELDLRRVLKAAEQDDAVLSKWSSFQLTRQAIKKDVDCVCDDGFLAGIQDAIRDEQPEIIKSTPFKWHNFAGKAAVAACFTFVFLIGANQWSANNSEAVDSSDIVTAPVTSAPSAVVPSGFELPPLTARTVSTLPSMEQAGRRSMPLRDQAATQTRIQDSALSPELEAQIQQLMLKHAESSAANGGMGAMPFTRVHTVDQEGSE